MSMRNEFTFALGTSNWLSRVSRITYDEFIAEITQ